MRRPRVVGVWGTRCPFQIGEEFAGDGLCLSPDTKLMECNYFFHFQRLQKFYTHDGGRSPLFPTPATLWLRRLWGIKIAPLLVLR